MFMSASLPETSCSNCQGTSSPKTGGGPFPFSSCSFTRPGFWALRRKGKVWNQWNSCFYHDHDHVDHFIRLQRIFTMRFLCCRPFFVLECWPQPCEGKRMLLAVLAGSFALFLVKDLYLVLMLFRGCLGDRLRLVDWWSMYVYVCLCLK